MVKEWEVLLRPRKKRRATLTERHFSELKNKKRQFPEFFFSCLLHYFSTSFDIFFIIFALFRYLKQYHIHILQVILCGRCLIHLPHDIVAGQQPLQDLVQPRQAGAQSCHSVGHRVPTDPAAWPSPAVPPVTAQPTQKSRSEESKMAFGGVQARAASCAVSAPPSGWEGALCVAVVCCLSPRVARERIPASSAPQGGIRSQGRTSFGGIVSRLFPMERVCSPAG